MCNEWEGSLVLTLLMQMLLALIGWLGVWFGLMYDYVQGYIHICLWWKKKTYSPGHQWKCHYNCQITFKFTDDSSRFFFLGPFIIWFYEPSRSIAFFMNIVQYLTLGIVYFLSIVIYLNGLLRFLQKMFVFNFLVPCEIFGTEICYLPWTLIILLNVYLVQSVSRPKGGIW